MTDDSSKSKRGNKVVGLGDAVGAAIDPVFRKRGFASREIVTNWPSIAPTPYDKVSAPDRLHWPRSEAGADGAVLYLRCADSHKLALAHEGAAIAGAVNRYFGYMLVGSVRLSAAPFSSGSALKRQARPQLDATVQRAVDSRLTHVEDAGIKDALRRLGQQVFSRRD